MSADEDTFEIDIYGDDHVAPESKPEANVQSNGHDPTAYGMQEASESVAASDQTLGAEAAAEDDIDFDIKDEASGEQKDNEAGADTTQSQSTSQAQGTKRKAEDVEAAEYEQQTEQPSYEEQADDRPIDQGATSALKLAELHWWTNEEDLRQFCAEADAESELTELAFGEHKINGKSKGEAYLEFSSLQAATATKRAIVRAAQVKEESGVKKTPFTVYFTAGGNPFRTAQGSTGKKEFQQNTGRGGSYNNFNNNRGNFGGRGAFNNNNNARGGFNANNNMMQNRATPTQQGGWGMNGMGGFGANPMMAAGYGNMAGMGGFGNMNRGGMMNGMGMMGRGGFPNMNMGMGMGMNMMGGGGRGGMMGGRGGGVGGGGWGGVGGFQGGGGGGFNGAGGYGMQAQGGGGGGGGGGGSPQQGGVNKRMKMGE